MRIRTPNNTEICTVCHQTWISAEVHPRLCNNCYAPDTACTVFENFAWYQTGLFGPPAEGRGMLSSIKSFALEEINACVVPITIESVFENNKFARMLFGTVENFNLIPTATIEDPINPEGSVEYPRVPDSHGL